ncbi:hypothetical protein HOY82DRAFT_372005 [Tuber indicum]|nr:hypothetical protein HOY82DRAFT_372005 [Tuber indicum]
MIYSTTSTRTGVFLFFLSLPPFYGTLFFLSDKGFCFFSVAIVVSHLPTPTVPKGKIKFVNHQLMFRCGLS